MAPHDHVESPVTRSAVVSFTRETRASLHHLVGGGEVPFVAFVLLAGLLAFLGWLASDLEQYPPKDSMELALIGVVLFTVAFAAGVAFFTTIKALVGRRPHVIGRLTIAGDWGEIGRTLRGEVLLSRGLRPDQSAEVVLTCHVFRVDEDGEQWSSSWEQVVDPDACADGQATRVPIAIDIPAEAPPSGTYVMETYPGRRVVWHLTLSIAPHGPMVVFVVPVLAPEKPTSMADAVLPYRHEGPPPARLPACSRVRVTRHADGGTTYRFPRPEWYRGFVWWTVLTLPAWVVLPWLAWREREWYDWPANLVWMLGLAALINGVPLLTIIMHRARLRVGTEGVHLSRWFFPGRRLHPREAVRAVAGQALVIGGRPNCVWLERVSGAPLLVRTCPTIAEARWLAADIDRVLAVVKERRTAMMDA